MGGGREWNIGGKDRGKDRGTEIIRREGREGRKWKGWEGGEERGGKGNEEG